MKFSVIHHNLLAPSQIIKLIMSQPSLINLINMIVEEPGYENYCENEAVLSISQLVMFNATRRQR